MNAHRYAKIVNRRIRLQSWDPSDSYHFYDQTDTVGNFQTLDPSNPVLDHEDLERIYIYRLSPGQSIRYSKSKGIGGGNIEVRMTSMPRAMAMSASGQNDHDQ